MGAGESVPGMTPEEVMCLERRWDRDVLYRMRDDGLPLFAKLDKDKSGTLDLVEFARLLGRFGFEAAAGGHNPKHQEVSDLAHMLFKTVDRDHSGTISRFEFAQWLLTIRFGNADQKIQFGFNLIDQDNDGSITRGELETAVESLFSMMSTMNLACPDASGTISALMQGLDQDHDGEVDVHEFRKAVLEDAIKGSFVAGGQSAFRHADESIFFGQEKFDFMLSVMCGIQKVVEAAEGADLPLPPAAESLAHRPLSESRTDSGSFESINPAIEAIRRRSQRVESMQLDGLAAAHSSESGSEGQEEGKGGLAEEAAPRQFARGSGQFAVGSTVAAAADAAAEAASGGRSGGSSSPPPPPPPPPPRGIADMRCASLPVAASSPRLVVGSSAAEGAEGAEGVEGGRKPLGGGSGGGVGGSPGIDRVKRKSLWNREVKSSDDLPVPAAAGGRASAPGGVVPGSAVRSATDLHTQTITPSSSAAGSKAQQKLGAASGSFRSGAAVNSKDAETVEFEIPTNTGVKGKRSKGGARIRAFHAGLFQRIRQHYGLGGSVLVGALGVRRILGSILVGDLAGLSGCVSAGKSGSFFLRSVDGLFMVKTISGAESKNLASMTADYYDHIVANPRSLLCRTLGHYEMVTGHKTFTFVVMANVCLVDGLQIHQQFDLKGSTYKRDSVELRDKEGSVLKDNDFIEMRGKLGVGPFAAMLRREIMSDARFLRKHHCVDYSLLVCVHRTNKDLIAEHGEWVKQHDPALRSAYAALMGSAEHGHIFQGLSFDHFCVFANNERRLPEAVDLAAVGFPAKGIDSHRITSKFEHLAGEEKYFFGIIDFLVPYNAKKSMEHGLKTIIQQKNHSVVPPDHYAERFAAFSTSIMENVDSSHLARNSGLGGASAGD